MEQHAGEEVSHALPAVHSSAAHWPRAARHSSRALVADELYPGGEVTKAWHAGAAIGGTLIKGLAALPVQACRRQIELWRRGEQCVAGGAVNGCAPVKGPARLSGGLLVDRQFPEQKVSNSWMAAVIQRALFKGLAALPCVPLTGSTLVTRGLGSSHRCKHVVDRQLSEQEVSIVWLAAQSTDAHCSRASQHSPACHRRAAPRRGREQRMAGRASIQCALIQGVAALPPCACG